MTEREAKQRARDQSRSGIIQHVNRRQRETDGSTKWIVSFTVSDWYDGENTVASYENGREL